MNSKDLKKSKGAKTREKILQAARKIFSLHPYHTASMRMIGQEAGVDHPLISYYFSGKSELYTTIIKGIFDELIEFNRESFYQYDELSIEEGFKKFVARIIENDVKKPWIFRIFALNVPQRTRETEIPGSDYLYEYADKMCHIFAEAYKLPDSTYEIQMYVHSFSFLLVHFLGSKNSVARTMNLKPESKEYRQWVQDTIIYIFLPRFKELIKGTQ